MTKPNIIYWDNGKKYSEEYIVDGKWHRDSLEGPARIEYHDNGQKYFEEYRVNGKLHRDSLEGPARINYHDNGEMKWTYYLFNGLFHNPYGPARFHNKHNVFEWYLNGIPYTNEIKEYLDKNNFIWQNMDHTDFDIMWTCIS